MKRLLYSIHTFFKRHRAESEMEDEMKMHIEMQAEEYMQNGLSKEDALKKAKRAFGNEIYLKEECRASWGMRLIDEWTNDLSYACRQLTKSKVFTFVALLSLITGIGVNVALFSTLNGILLKSLDVEKPDQLREIHWAGTLKGFHCSGRMHRHPNGEVELNVVSNAYFQHFQTRCSSNIAEIAAWAACRFTNVEYKGKAFRTNSIFISDNFFRTLRITPYLGTLSIDEQTNAVPESSVWISQKLWTNHFKSQHDIIGKSIVVNKKSFTILGVVPENFTGLQKGRIVNLYFPIEAQPVVSKNSYHNNENYLWLQLIARLNGTGTSQEKQLENILTDSLISENIPFKENAVSETPRIIMQDAGKGVYHDNKRAAKVFYIPIIMSAILLLVCCINLGGLQFGKVCDRIHELKIRSALGAKRTRLIRQMLCESIILSSIAAFLGVIVALTGKKALAQFFMNNASQIDTSLDLNVMILWLLILSINLIIIGVIPAIWVTAKKTNLYINNHSSTSAKSLILSKAALSMQVIFAIVLAVSAGLFTRTLINLHQSDTGFTKDNLLVFNIRTGDSSVPVEQSVSLRNELVRRLEKIPEVESVAITNVELMRHNVSSSSISKNDFPQPIAGESLRNYYLNISPSFFETMRIKMIAGNTFESSLSKDSRKEIVISQSLAQTAFPEENAIGKVLKLNSNNYTIVGVCDDIKYSSIRDPEKNVVYYPEIQVEKRNHWMRGDSIYIRTQSNSTTISTINEILKNDFKALTASRITTMEDCIDKMISMEKKVSIVSITFAAITLLLTCIGLFSLINFDVKRRLKETSIRLAFGATRKRVIQTVFRNALSAILPGILIGIPLAVFLMKNIKKELYEVSTFDFQNLAIVVFFILLSTFLSVLFPAIRSSNADPAAILRND